MAKFQIKEIDHISFDCISCEMRIVSKKNHLLFKEIVTEEFFNKSVIKLYKDQ